MNWYERHIGDYMKDAAHLSLLEHGIYVRLMDVYYSREGPIPENDVFRLIGARDEAATAATLQVLQEFFRLENGAWRQKRCDEEIARFAADEPERVVKRANRDARYKKHRAERTAMFKALHEKGLHPEWNLPMGKLRELFVQTCNVAGVALATGPATPTTRHPTATHSHSPYPSTQYPEENIQTRARARARAGEGNGGPDQQTADAWGDQQFIDAFAAIQAAYPPRSGTDHNWLSAEHAWRIRLEEHGAEMLLAAVKRYRAYVDGGGVSSSAHVLGADKFFGDTGRKAWLQAWDLPKAPAAKVTRMKSPTEIAEEYEARERAAGGSS